MAKYVYPAIFTPEPSGYSVLFPDLQGCYTCGDDLEDALYMAEDVLAFTLYSMESRGEDISAPSAADSLKAPGGSFVNLIRCDTLEYQKRNNKRSVRKSVTIPEWINEAATAADLNFSQVLQDALKDRLHLA